MELQDRKKNCPSLFDVMHVNQNPANKYLQKCFTDIPEKGTRIIAAIIKITTLTRMK